MKSENRLKKTRQNKDIYSINEIQAMFGVGRLVIDQLINSGKIRYISPNNKNRFIFLSDYIEATTKREVAKN